LADKAEKEGLAGIAPPPIQVKAIRPSTKLVYVMGNMNVSGKISWGNGVSRGII
jgi:hypothetical protein